MSHPVRRLREDPVPGESATLVVELGERDADGFREAVAALGGEVTADLQFDSYRVVLPQEAVDDLCSLDGLALVETANAVGYGGDAGEDVEDTSGDSA